MLFDRELFERLKTEFSGSLAKREVERISQFHRIQASPGFRAAAEYVLGRLRELKVGARIESFPSDGKRRYYTWTSPIGWQARKATLELLQPEKRILAKYPEVPCSLAAHSKSADIEAQVVDVETGLTPGEYEAKDLRGKVVLASRRSAQVYKLAMLSRGAAGILSYKSDWPELPDMIPYNSFWPNKSELKKLGFGFSLSRREGLKLKSYLTEGKKVTVRAKVDAELFPSKLDVVSAGFPGKGKAVLFIAHLCHPQPGANDNASGSGALLEMVRTIKALLDGGKLKLRRPVRFLWVPEMYGTIAYLSSHPEFAAQTLCAINLDMVGENERKCNAKLRLTDTPWSLPSFLPDLMLEALHAAGKEVGPDPGGSRGLFHYEQTPYSGGSDHYVLCESTWGVPSVMVGHWPDPRWHTHADTMEFVDATELARVGVASLAAGLFAAGAGSREATALSVAVEGHSHRRLSEVVADRFEHLRETKKSKLLSEFHRVRRHIEFAHSQEEARVYSVEQLSRFEGLTYYLENAQFSLASREVAATAKLERYVRDRLKMTGDLPPEPPDEAMERMSKVVPKRLFGGPFRVSSFEDISEETREYYRKKMKEDDTNGQRLYETLNFMDGRRTLLDIYRMVDAQFPFFEVALLERFIEDLGRLKLVRTRKLRK